ncbi:hypothetical protein ACH4F6_12835 [Streptomyces sp. NPDC017936]|uniref:hypothetical protein n=1 Tax=Streptomyces sp. NPDC017936 TaxID=3365016 RepID=UPI00379FA17D
MSADASEATRPPRRTRRRAATALAGLALAAAGAGTLVSCGSDDGGGGASPTPRPTAPDTAAFSGTPPSALASLGESVKESARAAASAAASSASARASEFEASVSAEVARANAAAQKELADVDGRGNATADVSLTGKPKSQTGGLLAVVVNITNSTDATASYAVQVDFRDSSGKVVETRFVGAEDLAPGKKAHPLAISRKPPEPQLTAVVAKAQRY